MEFDPDDNIISMFDEDGNETEYQVLTTKEEHGNLYLLVEAEISEEEAEVLIFKCINDEEAEEMIFELVDEEHDSFELALNLFKEDLDAEGISYE